jgi:hypothetical protein
MATKNPNAKRPRPSTANNTAKRSTSAPPIETLHYDPNVTNAAVTTLVRALLSALRHSLSVAYVSAVALRRHNFDLGIDLAPSLKNSLDGNLHIDISELERLLTYVYGKASAPRAH